MKTTTLSTSNALILPLILMAIIAAIAYATFSGKTLPLVNSPKAAIIALLIIGMALCGAGGIGQVGASGRWGSPLALAGYVLGALLLVVLIGGLAGWKLPLIAGQRETVLAASALIGVKYLIGTLGYFFHLL